MKGDTTLETFLWVTAENVRTSNSATLGASARAHLRIMSMLDLLYPKSSS